MVFLLPALAFSDLFSFRTSYVIPRAESDLWVHEFTNLNLTKNDYHNTAFSFSYEYFMTREMSLVLGVDPYYGRKNGTYIGYVGYSFDEGDFAFPEDYEGEFLISHLFDVSMTPVYIGLKLTPFGRRARLIPYVGVAGVLYLWNVRLQGDIAIFNDPWYYDELNDEIFRISPDEIGTVYPEENVIYPVELADIRDENKISFGYIVFGGFMFPIGSRLSIDAEFKYSGGKGNLTNFMDYEPFDLSAYRIAVGISYWF